MKAATVWIKNIVLTAVLASGGWYGWQWWQDRDTDIEVLQQIIARLQAETRKAEVLVTDVAVDPQTGQQLTTIKFMEYDVEGRPLPAKYFTLPGNIIQFQSLVVRFNDIHLEHDEAFRNQSAAVFWKVFVLDGQKTVEFEINPVHRIPEGYKVPGLENEFEHQLWQSFWHYALDQDARQDQGVNNAQIEAPGTRFVPGMLYTISIEHDGGLRIDTQNLSPILRGERIPS
jgi:hypothetical protein